MSITADYLIQDPDAARDQADWTPHDPRRAWLHVRSTMSAMPARPSWTDRRVDGEAARAA